VETRQLLERFPDVKKMGKRRGEVFKSPEWPWGEAKNIFEQPDVTSFDQIEGIPFIPNCPGPRARGFDFFGSGSRLRKDWLISW